MILIVRPLTYWFIRTVKVWSWTLLHIRLSLNDKFTKKLFRNDLDSEAIDLLIYMDNQGVKLNSTAHKIIIEWQVYKIII